MTFPLDELTFSNAAGRPARRAPNPGQRLRSRRGAGGGATGGTLTHPSIGRKWFGPREDTAIVGPTFSRDAYYDFVR